MLPVFNAGPIAVAYGKPCLAARAGGAPEVVNEEVGAVVDYGNTGEISTAISDILHYPRAEAAIEKRSVDFSFALFRQRLNSILFQL